MRRYVLGMAAAILAASGASASAPKDKPDIVYESLGCPLVACPTYRIELWNNGQGVFYGLANTVIMGEAKFSVDPDQYSAFAGMLAPYRPERDVVYDGRAGGPCAEMATDQGSVQISWRGPFKGTRKLFLNYGCDRKKNAEMIAAFTNAPKLLPTRQMIARSW